ncbi:MAG: gliding motility-associated C-terminal domain-containing protein [Chitinophagales bacterium]
MFRYCQVTVTAKTECWLPDQNISCIATFPGGTATMAATGTGTWTAMASNPGTATITANTSPTTTITTFSVAGTYSFIWTNGSGCKDTVQIAISSKPNAGADQTVSCVGTFPGGTATMAAAGTGTWTAMASNPGTATITNATSPTTTITTFSVAGTYSFIWTNSSGCTDTALVTVTGKPNAGLDQTVSCVGTFPGGTATMAAAGTGTWTAMASNPGTATITNATSPTTTITTFSVAGTYSFIWTNSFGCTDTALVTVTAKPNAGLDQTVNCVGLFPGGTATMVASGTGTWTAMAFNPGTALITANTSPTTTITTFSVAGTYNFIWTNSSGCTDTALVTVTAKPNAGLDQTLNCVGLFPGGTATMAATGTGTWTAMASNPGTATITANTSPTTTITTFSVAGTYNFIWTNSSGCTDTALVTVTAKPNAGLDQTVNCVGLFPGGTATMAATGTGTWTAMASNPGTATITANTSPTTTITAFSVAGTYNFIWTNGSGCTDTALVTVTGKPNAGADQTVSCVGTFPGGTATMAATGTGTWTAMASNPGTATITNATSPTTTITTFSVAGTYSFIWTNGSGCKDTVQIAISSKPNAGADQTVSCVGTFPGGTATMAATGTGTWTAMATNPGTATITTNSSTTTTITTFSVAGTYSFIWTNSSGCTDTAQVIVTAKPNAGANQSLVCVTSLPGGSITMSGVGVGTWTADPTNSGTAIIANITSPTTVISNFNSGGLYNYIWTNPSGCADTAQISVSPKPSAGPDQLVSCLPILPGGSINMSGTGSGIWSAMGANPGSSVIVNPGTANTVINAFASAGTYNFIWTDGTGCSDTMQTTVTQKPNAGADQQLLCVINIGAAATNLAASGTGTWSPLVSNSGTNTIVTPGSSSSAVNNFTIAGNYGFIWTDTNTCTDTMNIHITLKPDAGGDQQVCLNQSITMNAATVGGVWSAASGNPAVVNVLNGTSPTSFVGPFSSPGSYQFVWTVGSCTDTMTVTVKSPPAVVLNLQSICSGYSYTTPGGQVVNVTGTYYDTLTAINSCDSVIQTQLTVFPAAIFADGDTDICKGSAAPIHASGGLYYQWSPTTYIDHPDSANPVVNPPQTTTYVVTGYVPGPNQLLNADFSAGNSGFSSNYTYSASDVTLEGTYSVNNNATNVHSGFASCTDHTSGSGNYMIVNGSANPNEIVWQQTIQVNPGTQYLFGAWVNTLANGSPALLQFSINGTLLGTPFNAPVSTCSWQQFYTTWSSGSNTSATITIVNQNTTLGGNDFALDDIEFAPICFNRDSVIIRVHDSTATALNDSICQGQSFTLPGGSVVNATGTYVDTFQTIWGCDSFVITALFVKPLPNVVVANDTVCTGQQAVLHANVNPIGGTFVWTGFPSATTSLTVTPLVTTDYILQYTANGCTAADTGSVIVNPIPTITSPNQLICFGDSVYLVATGNPIGGIFNWNSTVNNDSLLVYPSVNTSYSVTYELSGCFDTALVSVTVKDTSYAYVYDTICTGSSYTMPDGTIVNISGIHNNLFQTQSGCDSLIVVNLTVLPLPILSVPNDSVCAGATSHLTATITGTGGSFLWQPGNAVTSSIAIPSITAGDHFYNVSYTDVHGCTTSLSANAFGRIVPTVQVADTLICAGQPVNLLALVNPGGGSYQWSNSATTGTITVNPTSTTTYSVTYTLSTCVASDTARISVHTIPTISLNGIRNVRCFSLNTGLIDISTSPASAGYAYSWNTSPAQNTEDAANLVAGTYQVIVQDNIGCADTASYTVAEPAQLTTPTLTPVDPKCNQGSSGSITATGHGGTGHYQYVWNTTPQQQGATASALTANTYQVTVTDDSLCSITASIQLNDPPALVLSEVQHQNVSCHGGNDGQSQVATTNGTPPFSYSWNTTPSQLDSVGDQLSATTYSVSVTDANSCTATLTVALSEPAALGVSLVPSAVKCHGGNDGAILATSSGGTLPYRYIWSNGDSLNPADTLVAGNYSVTVYDMHQCTVTATTAISEPSGMTGITSSVRTSCADINDGKATITISGGNQPYQISLLLDSIQLVGSDPNGLFTGLAGGSYWAVVTDAHQCQFAIPVTVPTAPQNFYTAIGDTTSCFGTQYNDATIQVAGGEPNNAPYQYSLDQGANQSSGIFTNVAAGDHIVVVTDNFGCDTTIQIPVVMPDEGVVEIIPDTASIELGEILELNTAFSPFSETSINSYAWSPSSGLSCNDCASPVFNFYATMTYHLTVTYNGHCVAKDYITIHVVNNNRFYIPNVFSPNGDGANDEFLIYGKAFKEVRMKIFNRWGEKLFESNSEKQGWDGTFKGVMQEPGVYVYECDIVFLDNKTVNEKGSVTLLK